MIKVHVYQRSFPRQTKHHVREANGSVYLQYRSIIADIDGEERVAGSRCDDGNLSKKTFTWTREKPSCLSMSHLIRIIRNSF